jgi:V8-like Glu-specific endopeptidase
MLMKIVTILSLSMALYTLGASADSQNVQEQINHDFVSRTMVITAAFDTYGVDSTSGYCGGVIFDSTTVLTSLHCVALETSETKPRPAIYGEKSNNRNTTAKFENIYFYDNPSRKSFDPISFASDPYDSALISSTKFKFPDVSKLKVAKNLSDVINLIHSGKPVFAYLRKKRPECQIRYPYRDEQICGGDKEYVASGRIIDFDRTLRMIKVDVLMEFGDSGGPVWIGDTLIGTIHAKDRESSFLVASLVTQDMLGNFTAMKRP